MALDDSDQKLIALLRSDARLPVAKLAARVGISRATVTARIARLRRDGVIAGFTVVLQSNVESPGVRAITMIEIEGKQEEAVTRRLMGMPEVRELHATNGRWDIVAEIEAASIGGGNSCNSTQRAPSRQRRHSNRTACAASLDRFAGACNS